MTDYVLGVDIGSGSVKLTLLSREGQIAATAGCEYPTYYPQVGWCEQDPEDWCRAFKSSAAYQKSLSTKIDRLFWQGHKDLNCHKSPLSLTIVNHMVPKQKVFLTFIPLI